MFIKIANQVFDSRTEKILLVLTPEERHIISLMEESQIRICFYPKGTSEQELKDFMEIE